MLTNLWHHRNLRARYWWRRAICSLCWSGSGSKRSASASPASSESFGSVVSSDGGGGCFSVYTVPSFFCITISDSASHTVTQRGVSASWLQKYQVLWSSAHV